MDLITLSYKPMYYFYFLFPKLSSTIKSEK